MKIKTFSDVSEVGANNFTNFPSSFYWLFSVRIMLLLVFIFFLKEGPYSLQNLLFSVSSFRFKVVKIFYFGLFKKVCTKVTLTLVFTQIFWTSVFALFVVIRYTYLSMHERFAHFRHFGIDKKFWKQRKFRFAGVKVTYFLICWFIVLMNFPYF